MVREEKKKNGDGKWERRERERGRVKDSGREIERTVARAASANLYRKIKRRER